MRTKTVFVLLALLLQPLPIRAGPTPHGPGKSHGVRTHAMPCRFSASPIANHGIGTMSNTGRCYGAGRTATTSANIKLIASGMNDELKSWGITSGARKGTPGMPSGSTGNKA
jgi:hypothetical protein